MDKSRMEIVYLYLVFDSVLCKGGWPFSFFSPGFVAASLWWRDRHHFLCIGTRWSIGICFIVAGKAIQVK